MPRHKHADLMIAYANDTSLEFEYRYHADDNWAEVQGLPLWNVEAEYRIKPPEKKKVEMWQWAYRRNGGDSIFSTDTFHSTEPHIAYGVVIGKIEGSRIEVEVP